MKRITHLLALLPLVASPLHATESGTLVISQSSLKSPISPTPPISPVPPIPPVPPTLSTPNSGPQVIPQVEIRGSKLGKVVEYLRTSGGVNIVLPPTLAELPVPDLTLTNVTAEGVLNSFATLIPQITVQTVTEKTGAQIINILPAKVYATANVCRVFKASAKERLQKQDLEQLVQNLADAATMVCRANARTQGRQGTNLPTIEAHPPTGILIVTGDESDVQALGQVVLALGGEVIPLTDPKPMFLNLPNGMTGVIHNTKGVSVDLSKEIHAVTLNVAPQIERAQKQVEQANEQAGKASKQVQDLLKQISIQIKPATEK